MAVIVRKSVVVNEALIELQVFRPSGLLSREDREQAARLDEALRDQVPRMADELTKPRSQPADIVKNRYRFGLALRKIIDDRGLVRASDVDSGDIWEAVWQYLPAASRPLGAEEDSSYENRENRRKGFFSLCYEISGYEWAAVSWIQRWHDWYEIASRPGLLRDGRVLPHLAETFGGLRVYPSFKEFQEVLKVLSGAFPTRQMRNSSLLSDDFIRDAIDDAVRPLSESSGADH